MYKYISVDCSSTANIKEISVDAIQSNVSLIIGLISKISGRRGGIIAGHLQKAHKAVLEAHSAVKALLNEINREEDGDQVSKKLTADELTAFLLKLHRPRVQHNAKVQPTDSINVLGLSGRARNSIRGSIQTVGELCNQTTNSLSALKGLGQSSLLDIITKLGEVGLSLREEEF